MNKEAKQALPPVMQDIFTRLKAQAAVSAKYQPPAQAILGSKACALTGLKAKI